MLMIHLTVVWKPVHQIQTIMGIRMFVGLLVMRWDGMKILLLDFVCNNVHLCLFSMLMISQRLVFRDVHLLQTILQIMKPIHVLSNVLLELLLRFRVGLVSLIALMNLTLMHIQMLMELVFANLIVIHHILDQI